MEELLQKIITKVQKVDENTRHSICLQYLTHFKSIELLVYIDGWKGNAHADIQKIAHLDSRKAMEELKDILQELEKLEWR